MGRCSVPARRPNRKGGEAGRQFAFCPDEARNEAKEMQWH